MLVAFRSVGLEPIARTLGLVLRTEDVVPFVKDDEAGWNLCRLSGDETVPLFAMGVRGELASRGVDLAGEALSPNHGSLLAVVLGASFFLSGEEVGFDMLFSGCGPAAPQAALSLMLPEAAIGCVAVAFYRTLVDQRIAALSECLPTQDEA